MTLSDFLKLPGAKVHDGSGCPVDGAVEALMLIGGIVRRQANSIDWAHDGGTDDIIAYREVQTP